MKLNVLLVFLPVVIFSSCKTKVESNTSMNDKIVKVNSECPTGGTCTVEVQKNKILNVLEDGTGALYPQIIEGEHTVVVYTFLKEGPEGTADGDYSETIHFMIPKGTEAATYSDASLQDVKLLFGKHCYCKGEAGYYPVEKGSLKVLHEKSSVTFNLDFKMEHPSHELNNITQHRSL